MDEEVWCVVVAMGEKGKKNKEERGKNRRDRALVGHWNW